jgi:hypothetical protein
MIGDEYIRDRNRRVPLQEGNTSYLARSVCGYRDTPWLAEMEFLNKKPIPEKALQFPHETTLHFPDSI